MPPYIQSLHVTETKEDAQQRNVNTGCYIYIVNLH